jgi:uncharacterized membrane protein
MSIRSNRILPWILVIVGCIGIYFLGANEFWYVKACLSINVLLVVGHLLYKLGMRWRRNTAALTEVRGLYQKQSRENYRLCEKINALQDEHDKLKSKNQKLFKAYLHNRKKLVKLRKEKRR